MLNGNKIGAIVQVLDRIVKNEWMHLPFAGNVVAIVKEYMVEEGIVEFPIIVLEGKSECGKSTLARAAVIPRMENLDCKKETVFIVTDVKVANLKKELLQRKNDYVVLDDFALFGDSDLRRKSARFLDEIARPSFAGVSSLMLLTVETGALKRITESLHSRVIILSMNNWKQFVDNERILEDLKTMRMDISLLLKEFSEWSKGKDFNIMLKRQQFLKEYKGNQGERSIGIFFAYDFAMSVFSEFLLERYRATFSLETFRDSYKKIWKKRNEKYYSNNELINFLFERLINEDKFECEVLREKQLCSNYCNGSCKTRNFQECMGNIDCCDNFEDCGTMESFYDPHDLILDDGEYSALVVKNIDRICGFPKQKKIPVPLFIIGRNNLVNLLNDALGDYCFEMEMGHDAFLIDEITSAFKENNICVSRKSSDHPCFSFHYPTSIGPYKKDEVYILRLSNEQYKKLCEHKENKSEKEREKERIKSWFKSQQRNCDPKNYKKVAVDLQEVFKSIRWHYGKLDL